MLVLTRRIGESIRIGDDIIVTLVQIGPGKVRLGIEAAPDVIILREELLEQGGRNAPFPTLPAPLVGNPVDGGETSYRPTNAK